uniref:Replication protein VP4 n=1 Tax=Gokushovirinae environmental samples TaxID=1478972 RepID=A0A2R3UAN7_9VIRU|nr:replication protein VP4 [Gokushovirinae environmental samples]
MGCDEPLTAYFGNEVNPATGKRPMVFDIRRAHSPVPVKLPCQRCIGCRLEHSRQWAMRCMHEKRMHDESCFLTVTYNDANLPTGGTLVRSDPQLFLKRLRTALAPKRFRFYGCGEYGGQTLRPHYHILIFGHDFTDKKFYKMTDRGERLYTSAFVEKQWGKGFNVIGDVTFKSCAYVSRYVTDKITGDDAERHYTKITADGEVVPILPEFSMMSRNGGIGASWFDKFGKHAYQFDSVVMNEREVRPPRFYDTRYAALDSMHMAELKLVRRRKAMANRADNTSARRHVKEEVLRLNLVGKKGV